MIDLHNMISVDVIIDSIIINMIMISIDNIDMIIIIDIIDMIINIIDLHNMTSADVSIAVTQSNQLLLTTSIPWDPLSSPIEQRLVNITISIHITIIITATSY